MQPGTFYGVGIGPGDPELVTLKAARLIRSCEVIFTVVSAHVSESVSEDVVRALEPKGRIVRLTFSMSRDRAERDRQFAVNAGLIAAELKEGRDCVFATLGDTLSYSTCGYMLPLLKEAVPGLRAEIVPGITSWSALAARAGTVLVENRESLRVVPSFTKDMAETIAFEPGCATVLLKTYRSRAALTERLRREKCDVLYGENLTQQGEFLTTDLDEIDARDENYLSLMVVRPKQPAPRRAPQTAPSADAADAPGADRTE
ncbi:MAG: precorrin-2 C(20)-methyltransferase [Desulfovibrionaceae bacterium]|nr:precorrin-2 C(20)-methyltransferase [Desulfovibrionaceae bacterium]